MIKSYTEDDVHKSLKYEIWSSTDPGNKRLDKAFKECAERGPIYLFFSVNARYVRRSPCYLTHSHKHILTLFQIVLISALTNHQLSCAAGTFAGWPKCLRLSTIRAHLPSGLKINGKACLKSGGSLCGISRMRIYATYDSSKSFNQTCVFRSIAIQSK